MELNDPSIISASPAGGASQTQQGDLTQFVKFLRNKNEASQAGSSAAADAQIEIEDIASITDYKPSTENGSKIYVYSINELLEITKEIPQEYIETQAELLPKKKFWRLYQRFPDNGNHKSNYRNGSNKSRSYSNEYGANASDRKGGRGKNGKNSYGNQSNNSGSGRKQNNKAMAVTSEELELDAKFETSGNAIADFEAWKAQMKDLDRQKKMGTANMDPSKQNRPSPMMQTSSKPASTKSSIISDFLKLSRKDTDSSSKNSMITHTNSGSTVSTEDNGTASSNAAGSADFFESDIAGETATPQHPVAAAPEKPADLSRSGSSRFTSFFADKSPENKSKAVPVGSNNAQESASDNKTEPQQAQKQANGSRLMNFFNTPSNDNATLTAPQPTQGKPDQVPTAQQPAQPMQAPMRMAMPGQQMPLQQGSNAFFQNLLNRNKGPEVGNIPDQGNNNRNNNAPNSQMHMPPPGMRGPQMGGMMQGPPPGLQSFNKGDNEGKDMKNNQHPGQRMGPPMGMPPPHMMQGNFMMPPHPGMPGFPGGPQGQGFPPQPQANTDNKGKGKNGQDDPNNRRGMPPQQQQFMPMMGPPPPGFIPMQGMPPNMQFPPNGMMMPPMPPPGKDGKPIKGNMPQGFMPMPGMPPNMNYHLNQNAPQAQDVQMRNGAVNQSNR